LGAPAIHETLRADKPLLSVVIPTYNEKASILTVIARVKDAPINLRREIIVVDDCSTDGTRELLGRIDDAAVHVLFHERNRGKGAAIRTALEHAAGGIVMIQDADLEYDPADYPAMLKPILDDRADAVFGTRFLGGTHRVLYYRHYIGNRIITALSNLFTNLNLTDMEVGYKAFRTCVLKGITIKSNRFGFEPEITAKLARAGCRIYEVPISYSGRTYGEGKKIGWRDGLAAVWWVLRYNLFR